MSLFCGHRLLLLGVIVAGCGASGPTVVNVQVTPQVTASVHVEARFADGQDADAFDPNDERLHRAMTETAQIIGHGVGFYFDVPGAPRPHRPFFEHLFSQSLALVTSALRQLHDDPMEFAFLATTIRRVVFECDGTRSRLFARFDPASGDLTVVLSEVGEINENAVSSGIENSFNAALSHQFANRSPAQVRDPLLPLYVRYLTRVASHGPSYREPTDLWNAPVATAIESVIAIVPRIQSNPALSSFVRHWLSEQSERWTSAQCRHGDWVATAPPNSPWISAKNAWSHWFHDAFNSLSIEDQRAVFTSLFVIERESCQYPTTHLAALDPMQIASQLLDRWVSAGRPNPDEHADDPNIAILDVVIRHVSPDHSLREGYAPSPWMHWAMRSRPEQPSFVGFIVARQDPQLTAIAAQAIREAGMTDDLIELWRASAPNVDGWRGVLRAIANQGELPNSIYDQCAQFWHNYPERRGDILYLLAQFDGRRGSHAIDWSQFPRLFGGFIARNEFTAFLSYGPDAAERAWRMFPALAPNVPRVELTVATMRSPVGGAPGSLQQESATETVVLQIQSELRQLHDSAGESQLRNYLETRMRGSPPETRAALSTLLERLRTAGTPSRIETLE